MIRIAAVAAAIAVLSGCGYHVAGRGDLLPKTVKTIAVPAFGNVTTQHKLAERLPADITREFIARTRYTIVAEPDRADAVLTGAVVNQFAYTSVADPSTGRSTGVLVSVVIQVTLTERATGKVLFTRPGMEVRERYEISVDPKVYFDESEVAMQRLSRDVARSVVSAVLENF
ncbi:MAG TPA: LPS assembly lipoprotein LptE [Bryobacteraceae bacterium]|nr:LPS assembly lipoprotein LptE [Bryobacteraceae bacterium]